MKKETYEKKLAATIITDENTVAEAKAAKKIENELKRFWKKEALAYLVKNEGIDLTATNIAQVNVKLDWVFNLKVQGAIVINVTTYGYFGNLVPIPTDVYRVLKRKILV